jgi:sugar phosphate isomerase/epimerase
MRSSVTISLLNEARGGPFVFWDDLSAGCAHAAELGFDAVELFAPSADFVEKLRADEIVRSHGLKLAAAGTGAGWLLHQLTLTNSDQRIRRAARAFIGSLIDWAASMRAPAIIGSMQGRPADREAALGYLAEELGSLNEHAAARGVRLFYEPLNRFETNLINRVDDGVEFLSRHKLKNVRLLADLFHMNIEEVSIAKAIETGGKWIGHVHLADSNRRAMGFGHTAVRPVARALQNIDYKGYVSAEVLPWPNSVEAAQQTLKCFRRYFRKAA